MKIKKILLFAKTISPALTAPVALASVSARGNLDKRLDGTESNGNGNSGSSTGNNSGSSNNGANGSSGAGSSSSRGKGVSPQFSSFADKAKKAVDAALKEAVEKVINFTEAELKKIDLSKPQEENKESKETYLEKLEKQVYLKALNKLFKEKKSSLNSVEDYAKLGLPVTFPFVISKDKKYDVGTVTYNGKEYKDIKIGKESDRDYSKVIETNNKDSITKSGEEENIASNPQFEAALNKYTQDLNKSILEMVYNPKEIPKFGKDIFLEDAKFDAKEGFTVKHPQNSQSWDDYIVKSIKPKFVDFDLKQNQEFKVIDETQPSPKVNPPNLPDINNKPLVPGKPPTNNETANPFDQSETLLYLEPYANYRYSSSSTNALANLLRNSSDTDKEKIFFFNNPINTRFKYTVNDVDNSGVATVKITDTAKKSSFRTYNIQKNNFSSDPRYMFLFQKQSETLSAKFTQLYKALMLDEKIDYAKLAHNELQLSLFGMVNTATKIVTDQKFVELWNNTIVKYAEKIDTPKNDDDYKNIVANSSEIVINELIQALSASELNNQPFWNSLVNALSVVESDLKEIANHKETRAKIISKFKAFKLDFKVLDNTFNLLNDSLLKLRASANNWAKSFQYSKWFDEYTANVADVRENIEFLRDFLEPAVPNEKSEEFKKLQDSYTKAINKIKSSKSSVKRAYYALGGTLLIIGLILSLTNVLIFTLKYKNKLNKAIKGAFGISISVSAIVALVGIILILLGLKG
ncbi:Hypothetical protein, predicted transmembrane protein [Mycoplasmopsis agalactiae 14628]|uniref:Transmembrane protein n=1 Tax=Mycoplasmopsis agalactiae 14628 TaxID=1110504 RepID=I5D5Y5_MYCAA|nr:hypothetical protein [Mycoplasmopsis agalactiae]EIN15094.1 Hypothetical protein, predicted transmembrane protein [Mycoplasmopsis agalactiae 14628]